MHNNYLLNQMSEQNKQIPSGEIHIEKQEHINQQQEKQQSQLNKSQKYQQQSSQQINQEEQSQQQEQQQEQETDGVTIFCRICQDFIAHSVTTTCQHTFCELCLVQYMLYIDDCPSCGIRIRHQRLSNNILLDNLIMDYIKKYEPEDLQAYNERIEQFKKYQREKKVTQFQSGMKIDIRDTDFVWCTGRIIRTVNKVQQKKVKCMIVKYDKSHKKEEFPENSPRIAPLGFYTNRKDIPRHYRGKIILQNQQENVVYSLPNHYEEEQEKQNNQ